MGVYSSHNSDRDQIIDDVYNSFKNNPRRKHITKEQIKTLIVDYERLLAEYVPKGYNVEYRFKISSVCTFFAKGAHFKRKGFTVLSAKEKRQFLYRLKFNEIFCAIKQ